jgi:hypothetical protein
LNGPSAFYTQHVDVEAPRIDAGAFQPYWRIRSHTRLDRLLSERAIGPLEWRAALRFRAAIECLFGDRCFDRVRGSGGSSGELYRLDAQLFVRKVHLAIGALATALIWSCVIDDDSWSLIGSRLHIDPKTARRWTIAALQALASLNQWRTIYARSRNHHSAWNDPD